MASTLTKHQELNDLLLELERQNRKTLLIGVSFALLDFVEKYPLRLKNTIVMETGGMKGRREEMVREQLHNILCTHFNVSKIHSEYGMTELLSQAYSKGNRHFLNVHHGCVLVVEIQTTLCLQIKRAEA